MKRLFSIAICFLIASVSIFATDILIGRVIDKNKQPVEFATVTLLNSKTKELVKGEVSNNKGEFLMDKINPGAYTLCVSMVGYKKHEIENVEIDAHKNRVIQKEIILNDEVQQLKEVSIVIKKKFIEQTVDKMVVNPEASITAESENVYEILKKLPGITIDNNDNISMKGKKGVKVLIDDKPTYMSSTELATMLKSLQGKNINKIEIIENPSARFDAEGNSGIINIKTKHSKAPGFNGSVNTGISQASKTGTNAGIDLNMNSGKLNVYGNYYFNSWGGWNNLDANRRFIIPGLIGAVQATNNLTNYNGNGHSYKVGADYYFAKNHVFSVMYRGNFGFNNNEELGSTSFKNINQQIDSSVQTVSERANYWNNKTLNVNYKWDIDSTGQSLTFDADYATFNFNSESDQASKNYDRFGNDVNRNINLKSILDGDIRIITAKADYVRPFGKFFNFESGLKASFVRTDNSANMDGYVLQNDRFIYDENIQAAYINGRMNLEKTSVQLGLRLENTNSTGKSISTNATTPSSYLKLFPSFFVQQKLDKNNDINFRYSYRIGRPSYHDLNPFVFMLDPYTYNQGNPLLTPQFTHSAGLTHSFKGLFNTSIGYNYTKDLFSQVLFQNDETKAIYQTNENLSNSIDWNISETFQLEPAKWWRVNGTLTGMYKTVNAKLGGEVQFQNYSFMGNLNNTFTINQFIGMELNGFYASKQLNGNFVVNPYYNVDFGVQCKLFDKKLTVKAALNDIFDSNHSKGYSKYNNIDLDFSNTRDSRQLRISLNYRFGKDDFKTRANRSTASSEEQSRSGK
ncbi:MAG: outer membrane beta-barrel protein [Paludibacter sp.]|nr:outer membrane beta-barrel protein [Paludibacter sp.]